MSVKISLIRPEEAGVVHQRLISLLEEGIGFPEKALCYYRENWTVDIITQRARNTQQVSLAAREQKEEIVGLLLGVPAEGGVATIVWVLVAPEFQRQGIGSKMFREACRCYRGMECHKIKLTVPNKQTVRFYEKQGMQVEGFHADHWWHLDFWSMAKIL